MSLLRITKEGDIHPPLYTPFCANTKNLLQPYIFLIFFKKMLDIRPLL